MCGLRAHKPRKQRHRYLAVQSGPISIERITRLATAMATRFGGSCRLFMANTRPLDTRLPAPNHQHTPRTSAQVWRQGHVRTPRTRSRYSDRRNPQRHHHQLRKRTLRRRRHHTPRNQPHRTRHPPEQLAQQVLAIEHHWFPRVVEDLLWHKEQ